MTEEKKHPREVAIERIEKFLMFMRIHNKKKSICKITIEFKDKKFNNRAFATIDMSNDQEFGNISVVDLQMAIESIMEKKMFSLIEEQVELNRSRSNGFN
jgi:hypothetical protein